MIIIVIVIVACIATIVIRNTDGYVLDYDSPEDIVREVCSRKDLPLEALTLDTVTEKGSFLFASYHVENDPASYLLCYRTGWQWVPFQNCRTLRLVEENSASSPMGSCITNYEDITILTVWGNNAKGEASAVSFQVDRTQVWDSLPQEENFISPFIFVRSTNEPLEVSYESSPLQN